MHTAKFGRRLRLGMVGGGFGANIGAAHRYAARLDDHYELVAGSFDVDPARGRAFASEVHVTPERAYESYTQMADLESERTDGVDAVSIVTPNHTHFPIALALVERGINVICEKPMTTRLSDAIELRDAVRRAGTLFGVCYTYSGYPLIHHAREMICSGTLGQVRSVQVEYALEWMAAAVESGGNQQAKWRVDPKLAGRGGAVGDIGSHAFHLAEFVSGLQVTELAADLATFVPGRLLDDNAQVNLRFHNGARGSLWASQVAPGNENGLRLRVYGEKGGLSWSQEQPNRLWYTPLDGCTQAITRGRPDLAESARRRTRVPPGHPEGYLEAFANLYSAFSDVLTARLAGEVTSPGTEFPDVEDGLRGVWFIEAAADSSESGGSWVQLAEPSDAA